MSQLALYWSAAQTRTERETKGRLAEIFFASRDAGYEIALAEQGKGTQLPWYARPEAQPKLGGGLVGKDLEAAVDRFAFQYPERVN